VVIRPADANEVAAAWKVALTRRDGPTALILTRQNLPILDRSHLAPASELARGAYVLSDREDPQIILIGTGSEVALVLEAQARLDEMGVRARVVSMPSWELFEAQPPSYREQVLPSSIPRRLAVEAAVSLGWERFVGSQGDVLSVERFGASAPYQVLMEKYGFTVENVVERAWALLG
ncbi:MAG: transketolase, partial [Chloroflexi bacterium]